MAKETTQQMVARIKRQDEEKEEAFQKRLKEIKADNAKWRARQEEQERAAEQERQKLHEGLRQRKEQEMKGFTREAWLGAGGTVNEFEQEWSAMRRQMLRERAVGRDSEARQEARERNIKAF